MTFKYPIAHRFETPDPYRWLRYDSEETQEFIEAQNKTTDSYLECSSRKRTLIRECLNEINVNTSFDIPMRYGDRYYCFEKNSQLSDFERKLYVQDIFNNVTRIFFDPKSLPSDFKYSNVYKFSEDGSIFAYDSYDRKNHLSQANFISTATGETYADRLIVRHRSFLSWTHDNLGIFYLRNQDMEEESEQECFSEEFFFEGSEAKSFYNEKIYYHRIGTPQDQDVLVMECLLNKHSKIECVVSDCGKWVIVKEITYVCTCISIYVAAIRPRIESKLDFTQIVSEEFNPEFEMSYQAGFEAKYGADYEYVANDGTRAIFMTNKHAPNYKLIAIDLLNFTEVNWTVLLPEDEHKPLVKVQLVDNDKFFAWYKYNEVEDILQLYNLRTGELIKTLPLGIGQIRAISGNRKYSELWFTFTSFHTPETLYRFDLKEDDIPKVYRERTVKDYNPRLYEIKKVSYNTKDNTELTMYIVMKKGAKLDGSMPALLKACNVFSFACTLLSNLRFDPSQIFFIEHLNGVFALADVRHDLKGNKNYRSDVAYFTKQISFDDFQRAAEFLIGNGYTSKEKLTIASNSCGSMLVSACLNQRPDLYGAAIVKCETTDVSRLDVDLNLYVSNRKNVNYFPLHSIQPPNGGGQYPATFVLIHFHCPQYDSSKFIATLQHRIGRLSQQKKPLLAKFHTDKLEGDYQVDELIFIIRSLGLQFTIPFE